MVALFAIIRRKGSKRFFGIIPTRVGDKKKVRQAISKKLKGSFEFRIVTDKQAKAIVQKIRPRTLPKKRSKRTIKKKKRR